jgi:hypothetical protein
VRSEQFSVWLGCDVRQNTTSNLSPALQRYGARLGEPLT